LRPALLVTLLAAALVPAGAAAREAPAAWGNYAHGHRSSSAVVLVVVHVAEGSFLGTVGWFRNPRARASSHYVVGRNGDIAHMVHDDQVAWHAGNGWVNLHSIGIEHEGYTGIDGTFTDLEYRASARLVAGLLRRYALPADRRHLIGHDQVPDPFRRGRFGGWAHHTDPGAHWDWPRYLDYVRAYREGRVPPPPLLDVALQGLALGQTVHGIAPLQAVTVGKVSQVEFLVDGVVRATGATFAWDSSWDLNGKHLLSVRATGPDGRRALAAVPVRTENAPPAPPIVRLQLPETVAPGVVPVQPELLGGPAMRLELWVDGVLTQTALAMPWALAWDASTAEPGPHTVAVRVIGPRGAVRAAIATVTLEPPPPAPAPPPPPAP
jgi:hypothetical protein